MCNDELKVNSSAGQSTRRGKRLGPCTYVWFMCNVLLGINHHSANRLFFMN